MSPPTPVTASGITCPGHGAPLRPDGRGLTCGVHRWPAVDGVAYLRRSDPARAAEAVALLDAGLVDRAAATLAADRDPWAPTPWPDPDDLVGAVAAHRDGRLGPAALLTELGFGPVADYFAFRWSTPTFVSGLTLASSCPPGPLVDLAAGLGQLGWAVRHQRPVRTDVELVWCKAWLGQRCVDPDAEWIVTDAADTGLPAGCDRTVVVHDALYFMDDADAVVAEAGRLAGPGGAVALGHLHDADARGGRPVGGHPRSVAGWRELAPDATAVDDDALATFGRGGPAPAPLVRPVHGGHAVSLIPAAATLRRPGPPADGTPLTLSPLVRLTPDGTPVPLFPSEAFAAEFGPGLVDLAELRVPAGLAGGVTYRSGEDQLDRLVAARVLVDVPTGWAS